jgi:PAS domain S-box-containing protein
LGVCGDVWIEIGLEWETVVDRTETQPAGILDFVPDAILLVREDGTVANANSTAERMFGYRREELLLLDLEMLVPERMRARHAVHRGGFFAAPQERPMGLGLDLHARRKDGSEFPIDISLGYTQEKGNPVAVATIRDISLRKQAEEELREAHELRQLTLDALGSHMAVLDQEGTIRQVNEAWMRFARENETSSDRRVSPGANYLDACRAGSRQGSSDAGAALTGILSVLDGSRDVFEMEYACDSPSERRWFLMSTVPVKTPRGGALVTHTDLTRRKTAQIELEKALAEVARLNEKLEAEAGYLMEEIETTHGFLEIVGGRSGLKRVLHQVARVAATDATVLILGETGTGKEIIARAIHASSQRSERPLIKVNCAALPSTLIESELFGHEKGAFTGASSRRVGRFELADTGTIFLDEIGDLALDLQAKLLRVLEAGEFERLGSSKTLKTDARVIAATNRDLEAAVADGSFRPDLFYRLKVFPLEIPPLRDRREDIPLLVWHFITERQAAVGRKIETVPAATMERLVSYDWPGNVRELEHVIERAIILSPGSTLIIEEALSAPTAATSVHTSGSQRMAEAERAHILRVLLDCGWKVKGSGNAAERLGLNPSTLRSRMKRLGIERPASR